MSSTIYDSVFRTLLNDCTSLIIPVINELFGTHYTGTEKIHLYPNENILTSPEGNLYTRITDSNFLVIEGSYQRYHFECESSENDSTMIIRMYEYDSQVALSDIEIQGSTIHVKLPRSAVIYLRHNSKTPDQFKIVYEAEGEVLERTIPTLKVQRYALDEIFEKELYYFLPFHIFVHEKELALYNEDENKRKVLMDEYRQIGHRLYELLKENRIDELTVDCIINGMKHVLNKISEKYETVVKEGEEAMGGEILDYPAKTAMREGYAKGRLDGLAEGQSEGLAKGQMEKALQVYKNCIDRGMTQEDALAIADISVDDVIAMNQKE